MAAFRAIIARAGYEAELKSQLIQNVDVVGSVEDEAAALILGNRTIMEASVDTILIPGEGEIYEIEYWSDETTHVVVGWEVEAEGYERLDPWYYA